MAPRAYNNETRQQQQAGLKARIASAAAQLHAAKGVLATSYAEIAQSARVSLPTVYKHFPSLDELVQACSGHVRQRAPTFSVEQILAAPDLAAAAEMLVAATDRLNAYLDPWLAWREQGRIPVLTKAAAAQRKQLTALCAQLLTRHCAPGDCRASAAVWESLLHFEPWHRMVHDHKLSRATVRRTLVHLLLAVTGPQPAAFSLQRPTPRKSA